MASEVDTPGRADRAKEVVDTIVSCLTGDASTSIEEDDEHIVVNISSDEDHQMLIGKRGQTLDALQFIANRMVGRSHPGRKRIVVDCERYRERRREQLVKMAQEVAAKVVKESIPYAFDSTLTPAERRIIHMELRELGEIETRSEGEGDERRLIVMPADE